MDEKSPDFQVEIPAAPKPVATKRKVLRSTLGVTYTLFHIFGLLTAMVVGGAAIYFYAENDGVEYYALNVLFMLTGLPETGHMVQSEEMQPFVYAALGCFVFGSLLQFLVPFQAYFSPKFLAKNPPLSNFWPLAVSFVLRIASEALYQHTQTQRHIGISLLWVGLSLVYCVLMVESYWYNDDEPPQIAQGENAYILKPWYVEPLELPQ